jgi:putative salt-induced outer membrane protein
MKFSILTAGAIACCLSQAGFAQQAPADGQWRGLAGASFSAASGNSTSSNVRLNLDLARQTERDKITTGAQIDYGRSEVNGVKTTTSNKWDLNGQYDYNLSERLYVFGKLGLQGDKVIDLRLRRTLGTGLGYKLIKEPDTTFDLFGGVANTQSRYRTSQFIDGVQGTRFSSTSLLLGEESTHKLSETVFFKQRVEVYPTVSGEGGTLVKGAANLGVALNSTISLNVGLVNDYNSAPAAGRKKNDVSLLTGLSVKLGN